MPFPKEPLQVDAAGRFLGQGAYDLVIHKHSDSSRSIVLNQGHNRMAELTVEVAAARLKPDEVLIKTWGANEGIAESLANAGLIADTGHRVKYYDNEASIYKWIGE